MESSRSNPTLYGVHVGAPSILAIDSRADVSLQDTPESPFMGIGASNVEVPLRENPENETAKQAGPVVRENDNGPRTNSE